MNSTKHKLNFINLLSSNSGNLNQYYSTNNSSKNTINNEPNKIIHINKFLKNSFSNYNNKKKDYFKENNNTKVILPKIHSLKFSYLDKYNTNNNLHKKIYSFEINKSLNTNITLNDNRNIYIFNKRSNCPINFSFKNKLQCLTETNNSKNNGNFNNNNNTCNTNNTCNNINNNNNICNINSKLSKYSSIDKKQNIEQKKYFSKKLGNIVIRSKNQVIENKINYLINSITYDINKDKPKNKNLILKSFNIKKNPQKQNKRLQKYLLSEINKKETNNNDSLNSLNIYSYKKIKARDLDNFKVFEEKKIIQTKIDKSLSKTRKKFKNKIQLEIELTDQSLNDSFDTIYEYKKIYNNKMRNKKNYNFINYIKLNKFKKENNNSLFINNINYIDSSTKFIKCLKSISDKKFIKKNNNCHLDFFGKVQKHIVNKIIGKKEVLSLNTNYKEKIREYLEKNLTYLIESIETNDPNVDLFVNSFYIYKTFNSNIFLEKKIRYYLETNYISITKEIILSIFDEEEFNKICNEKNLIKYKNDIIDIIKKVKDRVEYYKENDFSFRKKCKHYNLAKIKMLDESYIISQNQNVYCLEYIHHLKRQYSNFRHNYIVERRANSFMGKKYTKKYLSKLFKKIKNNLNEKYKKN